MKNLVLIFGFTALLQLNGLGQTRQPAGKLNINTAPLGIVNQINELKPVNTTGSYYLNDDWNPCLVLLKNGESGRVKSAKYNLEADHLEMKINNEMKALDLRYIEAFYLLKDEIDTVIYKNAYSHYSLGGLSIVGVVEILVEGKYTLVSRPVLKIQKADYIPALDTGQKSDKYIKHEQLFLADGNELAIKNKKKDWLSAMGDKKDIIEQFAKTNKLGFKKKEDLKKIIRYRNKLANN